MFVKIAAILMLCCRGPSAVQRENRWDQSSKFKEEVSTYAG
jgi:hypothetical protein